MYEKLDSSIINQVCGGLRDQFLLRCRDELTTAGFAFVVLISIMDKTVFDHVVRFTAGATWHWSSVDKNFLIILSLHLEDYPA
jgi:hypothetical protein